ncbi:MAG: glycosyltransferase [Patescibacteria group bacterium]
MKSLNVLMISSNPLVTGGGVPIYTDNICSELIKKGHRVTLFTLGLYDLLFLPHLSGRKYHGYQIVELQNSPEMCYSPFKDFSSCTNKRIEEIFRKYLDKLKPDILHIQNIMGLPVSLIGVAKQLKIPVIFSLHNYWLMCPEIELFNHNNQTLCDGPQPEQVCFKCIRHEDKWLAILRKATLAHKNSFKKRLLSKFIKTKTKLENQSEEKTKKIYQNNIDREGLIEQLKKRNHYIRYLLQNKVDLFIAVSNKVKELFVAFGVSPEKIIVNHIGTKATEIIRPVDKATGKKITFMFLGKLGRVKGFPILLGAFTRLDQNKCRLLVYGPLNDDYLRQKDQIEKQYSVQFKGEYKYHHLSEILGQADIGIVPPLWHDNAPQVVFEFFCAKVPVIGSNLGGIPDFVKNDINGLLFNPYQKGDLLLKMKKLIENPELIISYQKNIPNINSMEQHVVKLEQIYENLLNKNKIGGQYS